MRCAGRQPAEVAHCEWCESPQVAAVLNGLAEGKPLETVAGQVGVSRGRAASWRAQALARGCRPALRYWLEVVERRCLLPGCTATWRVRRTGQKLYCGRAHRQRHAYLLYREHVRQGLVQSPLDEPKREAAPGRCLACDEVVPPQRKGGRQRVVCPDEECQRAYHAIYDAVRTSYICKVRKALREEALAAQHPPAQGLQGESWARVVLPPGADVLVPQHGA